MLTIFIIVLSIFVSYLFYLMYPIFWATQLADETIEKNIPYEQHPKNPTMRILVAGDSSAAGVGAVNPALTIAGRLGKFYPNADMINLGVSGFKIRDLLQVLRNQTDHFDLLLLQIGANDVTRFTPYPQIQNDIHEVLQLANKLASKTILLTSGDMGQVPLFRGPLPYIMTQRSRTARNIFVEESAKFPSVSFIDLFYELKKNHDKLDFTNFYSPDYFHLSDAGYGIYYHFVEQALKDSNFYPCRL